MVNRKFSRNWASLALAATAFVSLTLTGCGSANNNAAVVPTPQGTISLDLVKVGMPESTFKDAILTFVPDPDPRASVGGKTQYLSRTKDANGGQYVVQCFGGTCRQVLVYYMDRPVSRETAMTVLKTLFPADAPQSLQVDEKGLKESTPVAKVTLSDSYKGELICADKEGNQVKIVQATFPKKEM